MFNCLQAKETNGGQAEPIRQINLHKSAFTVEKYETQFLSPLFETNQSFNIYKPF